LSRENKEKDKDKGKMSSIGSGDSGQGGTWSRVKDVLRDTTVDAAIEEARTSYLYQKLYEEERKKWAVPEVKRGLRVDIQDESLKHQSKREKEDNREEMEKELEEFEKELEEDPELRKLQEERREELKNAFKKTQQNLSKGFGEYTQMDEKDMLKLASDIQYVVVHFYSDEFQNCLILDHHLSILASKHTDVRFIKCDAKKSPFLVNKWKIKTLPTLAILVHGYFVDKVIGFTDLGNTADFPTIALERRLATTGVIKTKDGKRQKKQPRTQIIS